MARITFLGTAGSSAVMNRQLRSSGGIIFEIEGLQFHIDPGPGALVKAKEYGINPLNTTAVLVSHNHINHCNDLNAVIDAMTHGGIEQRGIVLGSKSILQNFDENRPFITRFHQQLVEKIIPLEKNHKVGIELIEVNTLSAEHTDPHAVGFKFFCPKFTLSYTGDTIVTDRLLQELTGSTVLILNVPYPGNTAKGLNLDCEAALKIVSAVKPRLAVLTHFGLEMIKADPVVEAREIQRMTGVQTIAAKDGLILTSEHFGNYRTNVKGYE